MLNLSLVNSKDKLLIIINNNLIITLSCFNNLKVDQVEARAMIIKDKEKIGIDLEIILEIELEIEITEIGIEIEIEITIVIETEMDKEIEVTITITDIEIKEVVVNKTMIDKEEILDQEEEEVNLEIVLKTEEN